MAIREKTRSGAKVEIDISGRDGNAFALMAYARTYAKQLGKDPSPIINEMISGDYDELLSTFDRHFGDYVDLVR